MKPEPETTKKETKTATEVPEPSGIEPFKETYFDEDNHVHYFRQVQVFNVHSSTGASLKGCDGCVLTR